MSLDVFLATQGERACQGRLVAARDGLAVSVAAGQPQVLALAEAILADLGFNAGDVSAPVVAGLALEVVQTVPAAPRDAAVVAQSGPEVMLRRRGARYFSRPGILARLGSRRAVLWVRDGAGMPDLLQDAMTRVMLLLLSHAGWDTLHAAGLASPAGPAVIISAPSRSGKSTLALGLARRGWRVLSDDLLLLDEERDEVRVRGWLNQMRLCADTLASVPSLAAHAQQHPDGKWAVPLAQLGASGWDSASPAWLVLPRIVDCPTSALTPVASTTALVAVAKQLNLTAGASSALTARQLARAARLVGQCRCFALASGRDLAAEPGRLADMLASV